MQPVRAALAIKLARVGTLFGELCALRSWVVEKPVAARLSR
jgi:hypothetical protein